MDIFSVKRNLIQKQHYVLMRIAYHCLFVLFLLNKMLNNTKALLMINENKLTKYKLTRRNTKNMTSLSPKCQQHKNSCCRSSNDNTIGNGLATDAAWSLLVWKNLLRTSHLGVDLFFK